MGGSSESRRKEGIDMVLSDGVFHQFSDLVYQECGINLHDGKKALLQARLNKCLRMTGISSYEDYYQFITSKGNADAFVSFLDSISTNLTFFFRETQHFTILDELTPKLLEVKKEQKSNRLRIWSAGCSTGEEPYSLAMCILSHLSDLQKYDFRILATDISNRALTVAMRGLYHADKIQKVPEGLRKAYFHKSKVNSAEGTYEVDPILRRIITFRRLNLKEPFPFKGPFDYIFCRNVMIYFDKKTQEALVQKMANYLTAGGYLFVGHSESLMGLSHPLTYLRPAVYRK
jgi:chemotaxis protein methyltransferase CheR